MTDIARSLDIREVPIEAGATLELLLSASDLRIRGTDQDHVVLRTRNGRPLDDEVTIETEAGRVRVRDGDGAFRLGPVHLRLRGAADLDIDVPRSVAILCRTLSGDISAEGIGGASRWNSASGDVHVAVDAGPVVIDTMSGDAVVRASVPLGLTLRTVSGDVRVRAPRLDTSTITATSGDIHVAAGFASGTRHTLSNVSGDVDLETDSSVRVETHSVAGDISVEGPHRTEGGRGSRTVIVGDGSAVIAVSTTSGDVRVRSLAATEMRPPAGTMPPAVPGAPLASGARGGDAPARDRAEDARLEVLRALERGELDVEAASHRLEVLEDAGPRAFRGWC